MRDKLDNFMLGRNGTDELSRFLNVIVLILLIISMIVQSLSFFFWGAGLILLIYSWFRTLSRNLYKRQAENEAFLNLKDRIFHRGGSRGGYTKRDKEHCYFKCPHCNQTVRVPRGKGTIQIHCPKCRTDFIRKT